MVRRKFNYKNKGKKESGRKSRQGGQRIMQALEAETGRLLSQNMGKVWWGTPPPRPLRPRGPSQGADYTTIQLLESFNESTGLVNNNQIQATGNVPQFASVAVELGDFVQVASFATVFDQYRIEKLHFRLTPLSNVRDDSQAVSPHQAVPNLYVVVDRDDATQPTTLSQLKEYDNVQVAPGTSGITVEFEPSITSALYAGAAFSGYSVLPSKSVWVDVANTTVPVYGIKLGVTALEATTNDYWYWNIECYATVSFKNTR
jgi:hypothetical protein